MRVRAAVAHYRERRYDRAECAARRLLRRWPDSLTLINLLASALLKQKKLEDAAVWFERSLTLDSEQVPAIDRLAWLKECLGDLEEACRLYQALAELKPSDPLPRLRVARLLSKQGQLEASICNFRTALALDEGLAEAHYGLAQCLLKTGAEAEALETMLRAAACDPTLVKAHLASGRLLLERHNYESAVSHFRHALDHDPSSEEALLGLGKGLRETGDLAGAEECFRRVLKLNPRCGHALRHISVLRRCAFSRAERAAMEKLAQDNSLHPSSRSEILVALAHAAEDANNHGLACRYHSEANRLARRSNPFDIERALLRMSQLQNAFTADVISRGRKHGCTDVAPIFIVGLPRSGKTSLEEVICQHPKAVALGERLGWSNVLDRLVPPEGTGQLAGALATTAQELGQSFLRQVPDGHAACRPVSTSPSNFLAIGAIAAMLPEATIIHCRRDRPAHCMTIFKSKFRGEMLGYSHDMGDIVRYYKAYEALLDHWRSIGITMLDVRYDELTSKPDLVQQVMRECGLTPHDAADRSAPSLGDTWDNGHLRYRKMTAQQESGDGPSEKEILRIYADALPALAEFLIDSGSSEPVRGVRTSE